MPAARAHAVRRGLRGVPRRAPREVRERGTCDRGSGLRAEDERHPERGRAPGRLAEPSDRGARIVRRSEPTHREVRPRRRRRPRPGDAPGPGGREWRRTPSRRRAVSRMRAWRTGPGRCWHAGCDWPSKRSDGGWCGSCSCSSVLASWWQGQRLCSRPWGASERRGLRAWATGVSPMSGDPTNASPRVWDRRRVPG